MTTDTTRVWLVERTYSDDEQHISNLVYTTPDGTQYMRKERALTSFSDARDATAAIDARPGQLGVVGGDETRDRYATEARRMQREHDPTDLV